jgi:uracil phosphoribosyltransferase
MHKEAELDVNTFDPKSKVVVVDLMRAGILPSQICFDGLHDFLEPKNIRQDHILLNRKVDANEKVVGVQISGHKIGGDANDAYVIIADPMGATGGSLASVIEIYENLSKLNLQWKGRPKKFIALHFIVTPEYLKRVEPLKERLEVFALRVDRGLSPSAVLKTELGERWSEERGLNDKQYIVPGAGGIGEILNNSFV